MSGQPSGSSPADTEPTVPLPERGEVLDPSDQNDLPDQVIEDGRSNATTGSRSRRSRSRASSRSSRRSSRSGSGNGATDDRRRSRSVSRVSMDRNVQTQAEADEAVQTIKTHPGGSLLLSLIKELNKTPGTIIDLKTIAETIQDVQEEDARGDKLLTHHNPQMLNKTQYLGRNPCPSGKEDRQHIRNTLLDIELNDRTVQRRMIDCPDYFRPGNSSISDKDQVRLDKVKIYFSAAFGNRKFSGKKGRNPDDVTILQLLQDFNHAQNNIPVTENEFVTFLTKAMAGEAHKTMLNYADLHRTGQMSVDDIYLSLTDIYFCDMRPNSAMQKLREMTENNHPYSSLSEAHNDLLQLCNLASLAARARERQIVLASDWYQQTLLRIIPREYKPMATSLVESCGNYKGKDLEPHEILNSLNKIRHPIDDLLRKTQNRQNVNARVKRTIMTEETEDKWRDTDALGVPSNQEENYIKLASQGPNGKEGGNQYRPFWKNKPRSQSLDGRENKNQTFFTNACRLCGNPRHNASACPMFPEGKNMVANTECKKCKANLFHMMRFCPMGMAEENSKN